jgi:hypothetical protein
MADKMEVEAAENALQGMTHSEQHYFNRFVALLSGAFDAHMKQPRWLTRTPALY